MNNCKHNCSKNICFSGITLDVQFLPSPRLPRGAGMSLYWLGVTFRESPGRFLRLILTNFKKVLVGKIRDRIFEIFSELATEKDWNIRALEVAPDHIHLFVEIHPTDAIFQVVKAFKGRSSNYLRKEFPAILKITITLD